MFAANIDGKWPATRAILFAEKRAYLSVTFPPTVVAPPAGGAPP